LTRFIIALSLLHKILEVLLEDC